MAYFSDIDINLTTQADGDITKNTEIDAVKNSLKNILSTLQGSRRMLPTFALNAYSLLFDPLDEITAEQIGEEMLEAIQVWDDRIIIENVWVVPDYDNSRYDVTINFNIVNSRTIEQLDFILNKL